MCERVFFILFLLAYDNRRVVASSPILTNNNNCNNITCAQFCVRYAADNGSRQAGRSKKYSKIPNWKKKKTNTIIKVYCDRESLRVVFLRFDTFIHRARVYNIKYAIIIIIKSDAAVSSENAINVYDSTAVQ